MELLGEFQITGWDEKVLSEEGESKQTHANVTQAYSGDIVGTSSLNYIMHYLNSAYAVFVGIEKIACEIDGKSGSFVTKHNGIFSEGVASSSFVIVEGSGVGACLSFNGSGSFNSTPGGKANYKINLN